MKIGAGTIVLVADGAKMLLLRNIGDAIYPELDVVAHRTIDNPPNREQMSDAPGLSFSSMGTGRSTYEEGDPHREREDRFAAEAAAALAKAVKEDEGDIIVVAPPDTLSVLRHHYDRVTTAKLVTEIDKDLTGHPVPAITRLILAQP
jgi:protein required for attachment to host cells